MTSRGLPSYAVRSRPGGGHAVFPGTRLERRRPALRRAGRQARMLAHACQRQLATARRRGGRDHGPYPTPMGPSEAGARGGFGPRRFSLCKPCNRVLHHTDPRPTSLGRAGRTGLASRRALWPTRGARTLVKQGQRYALKASVRPSRPTSGETQRGAQVQEARGRLELAKARWPK
jgi:hypothetical protein